MIVESVLTCPHCEHKQTQALEENIVPVSYRCDKCQQTVKINKSECCIYCIFGAYPCLQSQVEGSSCCARD